MRKFLIYGLLISLFAGISSSAQTPMNDSLAVYQVYPVPESSLAGKAPKGYKPFYISHIGRHGSRRLSKPEFYCEPVSTLGKAAASGLLTAEGEALLKDLQALRDEASGREGLLVPRGEAEHRGIIDRMCAAYPEVFKGKGKKVHVLSSEIIRTVMSMSCAMEELRSLYPGIEVERECGPGITKKYYKNDGRRKAGKSTSKIKKDMVRDANPERFVSAVFRTPSAISPGDARKLLEQVWECAAAARMHDGLGIDIYKYLRAEDVEGCWRQRNRFVYSAYGPSSEYAHMVLPDMQAMAGHIIESADAAIAGAGYAADFRFAHDVQVVPIAALMGIEGCTVVSDETAEGLPSAYDCRRLSPMAANIQLIFYRNARKADILVKVLLNEREVRVSGASDSLWPYYRWEDLKAVISNNVEEICRPSANRLRLALIGDIQVPDEAALDRVRATVFKDLKGRRDIDFAVLCGDLVEERCDLLPAIKAACDSMPFPVLAVPGNHDRDGALLATRTLDTWKKVYGYVDTTFTAKGVRFVFLNSVRNSRVRPKRDYVIGTTDSQKKWLDSVLASAKEEHKIVLTHGQLSKAHAGADSLYAILSSHPGVFLVEAHTHRASRFRWKGIEEFNVGAPYALTWNADPRTDLMNCGAPRGYFVADIDSDSEDWIRIAFRSVTASYPGQAHAQIDKKGRLVVNVYGGANYGKVMVDGLELVRLKEVCPETKRLLSSPVKGIPAKKIASTHIWGTELPVEGKYRSGDTLTVSYSDPLMSFTETITIR
ncbi:MAG: metallophosphoesterase [Bacteroidales bacterium]|nr:metallophosphoesterase [Bacteroidales bacterium]